MNKKYIVILFVIVSFIALMFSIQYYNNAELPIVEEAIIEETVTIEVVNEEVIVPEEDLGVVIEDAAMTYQYQLAVELIYEDKGDDRYVATTDLFHVTSYGQPTMMITYVVDQLHREYDTYKAHFGLEYIPQIRLFFYDDIDRFSARGTSDSYSAFQTTQEIHYRMPNTYDFSTFLREEIEERIVYSTTIHEFMHVMQYNQNDFALGTYEEPWLLEAMAEYGSMLLYPHHEEIIGRRIKVKDMEELREDPFYRYEYGEYIIEYIISLEPDITFETIMDNHYIAEYFEMSETEFFNEWKKYMHKHYDMRIK